MSEVHSKQAGKQKNSNGVNPSLFLVLTGSDVGFSRFLGGKNTTM